ncbi:MAG: hypothetical protein PHO02_00570 [Candidatus Nanoarchaeia archaeon]|nr:hypothetical protein [Candidatus Nanoarchaeia archaeon]
MNKQEYLEEMLSAAVRTFRIQEKDADEFADSVFDMLDAINDFGLEYSIEDCSADIEAYTRAANEITKSPETSPELAEYAAYTAGFITAIEYCNKNPKIRELMKEALLKGVKN